MRRIFIVFTIVFVSILAHAQFTLVTGTVVDPNGLPYANGTISPVLVLPGGISPTLNGLSYSPPTAPAGLDGTGSFTMNLADNAILLPALTTWNFTVCSAAGTVQPAIGTGSVCFALSVPVTITGVTQNISVQLNAVALPLSKVPSIAGTKLVVPFPVDSNIVGDGLTFVAGDQVGWAADGIELCGDSLTPDKYLGVALDDSTKAVVQVQMYGVVPVKLTTATGAGSSPVTNIGDKLIPSALVGHDGEFEKWVTTQERGVPWVGIALSVPDGFDRFDAFLVPSFLSYPVFFNDIPVIVPVVAGHAACIVDPVPPVVIGTCSDVVSVTGSCTCN